MKIYRLLLIFSLIVVLGCQDGFIDSITAVDPGPDESAPQIDIKFPLEGTLLQVPEPETSINIQLEVTDDIEISNISVELDGSEIVAFNEFKDYRKAILEYEYDKVTNGDHILTVKATDVDGKITTSSVNFNKALPYTPLYDGEIFYMPFDGDYLDLISFNNATSVGSPGFAGQSVQGLDAYAGATDTYLTFPTEGLLEDEFSAVFWMKVNNSPDRAGVLVIGPPDAANPDAMNNRTSGFRFFRENAGGMQRFKLNVGRGDGDSWFDGGAAADVDPSVDEWVHFAFTISQSKAVVYINGIEVVQGDFDGVDWTDCDLISIMSGAPRFTGWNHLSDQSFMDELRLFNKVLSLSEIQGIYQDESGNAPAYSPIYDGEVFYMPFEDDYVEQVTGQSASEVGSPGFDDGRVGKAYAGAIDSYLTFPTSGLQSEAFSAVFWMKLNADPDRAGILVMGPPDVDNADFPDVQNLRTSGFRFFRENAAGMQRVKLNAGNGMADTWVDGGDLADVDPAAGQWVHYAFTISGTEAAVYINGDQVQLSSFDGIDWTGCDVLSIMSGAPRFSGWNHLSDQSLIDELRLFNKALSESEIETIINAES